MTVFPETAWRVTGRTGTPSSISFSWATIRILLKGSHHARLDSDVRSNAASGGTPTVPKWCGRRPSLQRSNLNTECSVDGIPVLEGEVPKTYIGGVMDAYLVVVPGVSSGLPTMLTLTFGKAISQRMTEMPRSTSETYCSRHAEHVILADHHCGHVARSLPLQQNLRQDFHARLLGMDMKQHTAFGSSAFANQYGRDWYTPVPRSLSASRGSETP